MNNRRALVYVFAISTVAMLALSVLFLSSPATRTLGLILLIICLIDVVMIRRVLARL